MIKLNPQIFREYDIRGLVDNDLSNEFAYLLGRAYGQLARENGKDRISVGNDCRLSSEGYAQNLSRGIADEGLKVFRTGMGPTPQLYFAVFTQNMGGGIQVTGSHNPSNMNGFKICLGTHTLSGGEIQDIRVRMEKINASSPTPRSGGAIESLPMRDLYIKTLIENSKPHMGKKKIKVVVDAGNGVGGLVGPAVLRGLGVEVIELFCEPDGRFPNHHPDPTEPHNLTTLIETVKREKADLGIGWDGDADRIGAVDENGKIIFGDMLLLLYARQILKEQPGATIIGDVKCSSLLFDSLKRDGAEAIMWKSGHSLVKNKIRETGAALGGEMSGHIFFKHRFYGFDDALYSSSRLIEIVSHAHGPLSSLLSDLPVMVSTPEIRVDCPEEVKFRIPERAKEAFGEFKVTTIDGVRVQFENGWALVRASNTQPVLVMRFEADNQKNLDAYRGLVLERIEKIRKEIQVAG